MKYTRRSLTEALADLSIEKEFIDALPSVADSVPVDKFSEKSTPPLTAMQYLQSYKKLYSLYQLAVKNTQLQSLMLSMFLIMQGISGSDELDNATIDELISTLADKVTAMIKTPAPAQPAKTYMSEEPTAISGPMQTSIRPKTRPVAAPNKNLIDVYPPRGDMEMDPENLLPLPRSPLAPTTSPRPKSRPDAAIDVYPFARGDLEQPEDGATFPPGPAKLAPPLAPKTSPRPVTRPVPRVR
jgi:hypothetical protein